MTAASLLLILVAFLAALALVFVLAKALKNWVFELSPGQWVATIILVYSLGVLSAAYIDGNWNLLLLSVVPSAIALVWWIVKLVVRQRSASSAGEAA